MRRIRTGRGIGKDFTPDERERGFKNKGRRKLMHDTELYGSERHDHWRGSELLARCGFGGEGGVHIYTQRRFHEFVPKAEMLMFDTTHTVSSVV